MFHKLVRLLVRLFFFALIAGAVGFVITRLMGGEDDDFEDFEDLESSFEFNETPVEIDVSGPATTEAASMDTTSESEDVAEYSAETRTSNPTVALSEESEDSDSSESDESGDEAEVEAEEEADSDSGDSGADAEGPRLIDIKGIGPNYEARLKKMGISSMSDLLNADSEQIVESASVIGGVTEVEDWKEQARAMTNGNGA